jgi:hypothetical protein
MNLEDTLASQRATAREQLEAAWQLHIARIEEQLAGGWKEHLGQIVEERFAEVRERVDEAFAQDLETKAAEIGGSMRRELADRFNAMLRQLRGSETETDLYTAVLESCGVFCRRAALLLLNGSALRSLGSRDFGTEASGLLGEVEIPLDSAPALASAVQAGNATSAARTAAELSSELAVFFGEDPEGKVGLFPIVCGEKTVAVLSAGAGGEDISSGLEWLAQTAGLILDARAAAAVTSTPEPDWRNLLPEDQERHLQAQRFARVHVAEMRLYKAQAVRDGRAQKALYAALKPDIDAARDAFRKEFIEPFPSMPDYLHQELVRTLSNDDALLLGPDYPGPLA